MRVSLLHRSVLAAVIIFALVGSSAYAGGGVEISFSPESTSTTVGATVAVDVNIANVVPDPGLAGYDLILTFDPAVVRLDSLDDSGFVESSENVVICVTGEIDNVGGSVNANCTAIPLSGAPGVSTTAPVALLHGSFTGVGPGASPLTLSGTLSGPDGSPIAASFGSGAIEVTAAAPPPPETVAAGATPDAETLPGAGTLGPNRPSSQWAAVLTLVGAAVLVLSSSVIFLFPQDKANKC